MGKFCWLFISYQGGVIGPMTPPGTKRIQRMNPPWYKTNQNQKQASKITKQKFARFDDEMAEVHE